MEIQKILDDIFILEPELKKYETEIRKIVEKILAEKPDTRFDTAFAERLKNQLQAKGQTKSSWWKKIYLPQFGLGLGGALTVLFFVLMINNFFPEIGKRDLGNAGFKTKITMVSDHAFGNLIANGGGDTKEEGGTYGVTAPVADDNIKERSTALGIGGGGVNSTAMQAGNEKISGTFMPAYITDYKYEYVGGDIVLPENLPMVYKKEINAAVASDVSRLLSGFNFNLLNVNGFLNSQIDSFILSENREFGYTVYFSLIDNNISITSNWKMWPQISNNCQDENCWKKYQLTEKDVPADEELISITDQFIKQYGINIDSYDKGIVNQSNRYYAMDIRAEQEEKYVSEISNILYPLKINELKVYDTNGEPVGLSVGVNIRYKKVSDVSSIMPANYLSSVYELTTDVSKLVSRAEQGGFYPAWHAENPTQTITVKLGDPTVGLVRYYQYDTKKNENYELYVPALIFPVTNYGETGAYYKNVTVPLVTEIFEESSRQDDDGGIKPLTTPSVAPMIQVETIRQ